ncbi:MAG TPA: FadR/GntR family transcriptional regulator [Amaricoccus sp.]|uniref:FadR/GntR family transcriptional regulator n=1 Tax=Amaricoccus sp. TaxID=1872485 RepID=UPI002BA538C4|nr:FadR/GntR family transcriptional regulator [Amaricoccus sp.]HMQ94345.1 FadR/GntR family transcriptional regulator [Amaricoccus sp.]HMR52745.1 FadR/GntR family transcriptional regulator [Amaricoccus sp.]HMT99713.1 FadR/GntR family transcriptional regulator [Amaricoccus sp.]
MGRSGETIDSGDGGLVSAAVGAISDHIRRHGLGPGDRLPSEADLSRSLAVSRSVVREALRALSALRLIDLRAGRRALVAELDYGAMSSVIAHGLHTDQITILQVYDVRRTIETRTAALAALHRSDAEAEEIGAHAEAMRRQIDLPERVMEEDLGFHRAIARAARNPVFALIVGSLECVSRQTWPINWRSRARPEEQIAMIDIHRDIARAIAAGDPGRACEAMARHFDESVRVLAAAGQV